MVVYDILLLYYTGARICAKLYNAPEISLLFFSLKTQRKEEYVLRNEDSEILKFKSMIFNLLVEWGLPHSRCHKIHIHI